MTTTSRRAMRLFQSKFGKLIAATSLARARQLLRERLEERLPKGYVSEVTKKRIRVWDLNDEDRTWFMAPHDLAACWPDQVLPD